MTAFFALLLPFALLVVFLVWTMVRRSPLERCKRLFVKIATSPHYKAADSPKLVNAVQCEDEAYLKQYLRSMDK